jgi:hypothetical protein
MTDSLGTYLHDHLAGAAHAIDLVQHMRDEFAAEPLGAFAGDLLVQIEEDRNVLRDLANRLGTGSSEFKEIAAWLSEKVVRLKLGRSGQGLGAFEALEFLELGIHGKWALWRALAVVAEIDPRLHDTDFERLASRAELQRASVDRVRLERARTAFEPSKSSSIA